jgi:hypothetical protein
MDSATSLLFTGTKRKGEFRQRGNCRVLYYRTAAVVNILHSFQTLKSTQQKLQLQEIVHFFETPIPVSNFITVQPSSFNNVT